MIDYGNRLRIKSWHLVTRVSILILLIFILPYKATCQNKQLSVITELTNMQLVGRNTNFLEDPSGLLSIHDVLKDSIQTIFKPLEKGIFSSPPTASAFWFKFDIKNNTGKNIWLEIGDATSWYLDFYSPDSLNQYSNPILLGSLRPSTNNEFPSNYSCAFLTNAEDTTHKTYYLKINGPFPIGHIFRVGTTTALAKHTTNHAKTATIFIGLIISMIIYNFFLLYATKDLLYLLYIAYLCSALFTVTFNGGYPITRALWFWEHYLEFQGIFFLFAALFSVRYLQLYKFAPKFNRWVWVLSFVLVIVLPILNFLQLVPMFILITYFEVIGLLYFLSLFTAGVIAYKKGYKNARFYILAWCFVIISVFIFAMAINSLAPLNDFTNHIMYYGFGFETLFFAFALGDRFKSLKKEKEIIQAQNISLIEQQNKRLDELVTQRTHEIKLKAAELQGTNEALNKAYSQLEQKSKLVTDSIKYAKRIQSAILPLDEELQHSFAEHFIIYQPKDIVSGDFYWFSHVNNYLFIAVVDCTGHGVPGAFMSMLGNTLLNEVVNLQKILGPTTILKELDQRVKQTLRQTQTKNADGMDMSLCRIEQLPNKAGIELVFSGAKNPCWLAKGGDLVQLAGSRRSIGGFLKSDQKFICQNATLAKGDALYLFSDGFRDQSNSKRQRFGTERLRLLMQEINTLPMQAQKNSLLNSLKHHQSTTMQRDDITFIGIRF